MKQRFCRFSTGPTSRLTALALGLMLHGLALPGQLGAQTAAPAPLPEAQLEAVPRVFSSWIDIELMGSAKPVGLITAERDGALWFSAPVLGALGRIDRETRAVSYFHLGRGAKPVATIEGSDGTIYAADRALNLLHRIIPETGAVTRIPLGPYMPFIDLVGLAAAPDGKIWFIGAAGWIGMFDPETGTATTSHREELIGLSHILPKSDGFWLSAARKGQVFSYASASAALEQIALPPVMKGARLLTSGEKDSVWIGSHRTGAILHLSRKGILDLVPSDPDRQTHALLAQPDGSLLLADGGRGLLLRRIKPGDAFEKIGVLGEGGLMRGLVAFDGGVAVAINGADRIRLFSAKPQIQN